MNFKVSSEFHWIPTSAPHVYGTDSEPKSWQAANSVVVVFSGMILLVFQLENPFEPHHIAALVELQIGAGSGK